MKKHGFTIIASGLDPSSEDFENSFFDAGCDDATIAFVKGAIRHCGLPASNGRR